VGDQENVKRKMMGKKNFIKQGKDTELSFN